MTDYSNDYNIIIVAFGISMVIVGIYWHHRFLEEAETEESYSYTNLPQ
jgi:hypothetical protein